MLVLPGYFLIIINIEGLTASTDADPGPQDPCCGGNRQIHTDYQVLWRKRDCVAILSRGKSPDPSLTDFYCFSGHIILRMTLIYYAQVRFRRLQKTKERVLLITSKRKDIYKCKGKSG